MASQYECIQGGHTFPPRIYGWKQDFFFPPPPPPPIRFYIYNGTYIYTCLLLITYKEEVILTNIFCCRWWFKIYADPPTFHIPSILPTYQSHQETRNVSKPSECKKKYLKNLHQFLPFKLARKIWLILPPPPPPAHRWDIISYYCTSKSTKLDSRICLSLLLLP